METQREPRMNTIFILVILLLLCAIGDYIEPIRHWPEEKDD